jgi:hypothetical protein
MQWFIYFYLRRSSNCCQVSEVAVEVKLRPTVSRPISLGVRHPSGTSNQFFFRLEIFFRQLRVCYFVALSLARGRVCSLMLLLVLASAVTFGSESRGTQDHILLNQFLRLHQPGGPGPRIYNPQEQGGPDIPPGAGFQVSSMVITFIYNSVALVHHEYNWRATWKKSSCSGLENQDYGRRDPPRWPHDTPSFRNCWH